MHAWWMVDVDWISNWGVRLDCIIEMLHWSSSCCIGAYMVMELWREVNVVAVLARAVRYLPT